LIPSRRRRRAAWAQAVLLCLASIAGSAAAQSDDLATRTFTIQFKALEDVLLLLEPFVGERGSYTVQPRLKTITVFDEPDRLRRISDVIADFDQPPRSVRLLIQLLNASEAEPAADRRPGSGTGVPNLLRDVTKWSEVSVLGSASILAVEGADSSLNVGERFRVRFQVGTVAHKQGVVKFDRFALDRVVKNAAGEARHVPIWDTVINLRHNQHLLLGATSSQESRRAIFLSVKATIEPPGGMQGLP
jgi:hypothetical protein